MVSEVVCELVEGGRRKGGRKERYNYMIGDGGREAGNEDKEEG